MTLTLASKQGADMVLQPVVDPIRALRAAAERPLEERTTAVTDALTALASKSMDAATEAIARDFIKRGRLLQPLASFDRIVREARGSPATTISPSSLSSKRSRRGGCGDER